MGGALPGDPADSRPRLPLPVLRARAVKPDAAIFDAVVARLPVPPPRVLFLDDNVVNVEAADGGRLRGPTRAGLDEARAHWSGPGYWRLRTVLARDRCGGHALAPCANMPPWSPTAPCCASCRASLTTTRSSGRRARTGVLRFLRCNACDYYNHPPGPVCRRCLSPRVAPQVVSGRGHVETFTVNYQQWIPGSDPYIIAWVAIDEQPDVRLTTNLVDVEPEDVRIGMPVRGRSSSTSRTSGSRSSRRRQERVVSPPTRGATGAAGHHLGYRPVRRRPAAGTLRPGPDRGGRAGRHADAGLQRDDIDGLSTYPGMGAGTPGFGGPTTPEVQDALGLSLNWHDGGGEGPGQMRAVIAAPPGRGGRTGPPRPGVSHGDRGHRPGHRRAARAWAASGGGGGGVPALRRLHAVVAPLRRRVGGQLDRHGGAAPHARVRPDPRAAGPDRHQRPAQCRAQPQGDLHRPDVDGGLPGGAHDLHPALPLRLRRAV